MEPPEPPEPEPTAQQKKDRRKRWLQGRLAKSHSVDDLLVIYRIGHWNYLIIGDGSGTTWTRGIGWGAVVIDEQEPHIPHIVSGGASCGTNIVAEMMSFAWSLMWIAAQENRPPGVVDVHVFTDCEFLLTGAGTARRKKNRELWAMIDTFRRQGVMVHWHWMPRDVFFLNQFCHDLANVSRTTLGGADFALLEKYEM